MSSSSFMLRLPQPFVAREVAIDDALQQLIFGSLSRPPEHSLSFFSCRNFTCLVCPYFHPLLSSNSESGTMVYDDCVEFWIYLASRFVHSKGELWLESLAKIISYEIDTCWLDVLLAHPVFILLTLEHLVSRSCLQHGLILLSRLCIFTSFSLSLQPSVCCFEMLLISNVERLILLDESHANNPATEFLVPHLFDGFYASVISAQTLLSSMNSLDQVKTSAIIAVQRMLLQSSLLAIEDQLLISFIKFLPRLKKETSFFSCWLLCHARYASPKQKYIRSRRTTHSVYGVLYSELMLLLCASVLLQLSFTAYTLSHADILNMALFFTELLLLEESLVSSRFLSNKETFAISYTPATLQFRLLRFVLDSLDEHQMLQHIQELMLNGNGTDECARQRFLDFSETRDLVVRLSPLKKTTVLNCDTLCVSRHLPLLLELPYGSSPRPPDDHTSAIHPSNSTEAHKI